EVKMLTDVVKDLILAEIAEIPEAKKLSENLWISLSVINTIHRIWRSYHLGIKYSQSANLLVIDKTFLEIAKDIKILNYVARCLVIVSRIDACVDAYKEIGTAVEELKTLLSNNYPLYIEDKWQADSSSEWIAPQQIHQAKYILNHIVDFIERIADVIFQL